jgi:MSHA biogenesis protein MshP
MRTIQKLQRGFSLITAIFLLVVLAGLGTMAVTFFTAQQQSSALDVQGSRAYQAARAGIEWGAYQVLVNSTCISGSPTLTGTLSTFTVAVVCTPPTTSVDGANVYNITASAVNGSTPGSMDYVERVMQATIASGVSSTDSGIIYQSESYN